MNIKEFHADIAKTFERCKAIVKAKNHDYSGVVDPFNSFVETARDADIAVQKAIFTEIVKKRARLSNLFRRPAKVLESIEDTIIDMINYLAILLAWIHSKRK